MKIISNVIKQIKKDPRYNQSPQKLFPKIYYMKRRFSKAGIEKALKIIKEFKILFLAKFYLLKKWLKIWGVTNSNPLKKISSSRFVKGGRIKKHTTQTRHSYAKMQTGQYIHDI